MANALWRWFEADGTDPPGTHWHLPCELRVDDGAHPSSSPSASPLSSPPLSPQCNPSCFAGLPSSAATTQATPAPDAHEAVSLVWPRPTQQVAAPMPRTTPSSAVVDGADRPRSQSEPPSMTFVVVATAFVSLTVGVALGRRSQPMPSLL